MKAIFGMGMAVCVALTGCGNLFSPGEQTQPAVPNAPGSGQTPREDVRADKDSVGTKGDYEAGIITTPISQYFRIQDRIKLRQIEHAVKLYHAQHGRYPKSFKEFEQEILIPGGIALPSILDEESYFFDSEKGQLMVNRPRK